MTDRVVVITGATFGEMNGLLHPVGGWSGGEEIAATSAADMQAALGQHVVTSFHMLNAFVPLLRNAAWAGQSSYPRHPRHARLA